MASTNNSCKEFTLKGSGEMEHCLEENTGSREIFLKGIDVSALLDSTERGQLIMLGRELDNDGRP